MNHQHSDIDTVQLPHHLGQIRSRDNPNTPLNGQRIGLVDNPLKPLLDRRGHLDADVHRLTKNPRDRRARESDAIVAEPLQYRIPQLARRRRRARVRLEREWETDAEPDEATTTLLQRRTEELVRKRRLAAAHARRDKVERPPEPTTVDSLEEINRVPRERVVRDDDGLPVLIPVPGARPLTITEPTAVARHTPHPMRLAEPEQQMLKHAMRHGPAVDEDERHGLVGEVARGLALGEPSCPCRCRCWVVVDVVEACAICARCEVGHPFFSRCLFFPFFHLETENVCVFCGAMTSPTGPLKKKYLSRERDYTNQVEWGGLSLSFMPSVARSVGMHVSH